MKGRFEIAEILAQDRAGVVYRALDRETGGEVALRRLLPRGLEGGGLNRHEAVEYLAAADKLAGLKEAGLRAVVGWGVDGVDGMPWLATEWSEGETLASVMRRGQLSVEAGRMLVEQGLAVQVALDARAPGWRLATDPESVVVVTEGEDFRFTWWVEPFPGSEGRGKGVALEIAELAELALGWKGVVLPRGAGGGLADWIRRVRSERLTASGALAALAGAATTKLDGRAEVPLRSSPAEHGPPRTVAVEVSTGSNKSKWIILVLVGCSLVAAVAGWWYTREARRSVAAEGGGPGALAAGEAAKASERAAELARKAAAGASLEEVREFRSDEGERVRQFEGQRVAVTGVLARVFDVGTGKPRYLEFEGGTDDTRIYGRFFPNNGPRPVPGGFRKCIGKTLRIEGVVRIESDSGRVVVHLTRNSPAAVVGGD